MSDIRLKIFDLPRHDVKNNIVIERTGEWHFQKNVYVEQMHNRRLTDEEVDDLNKRKERYADILSKSRFSLCPSGSGPNSIRLWESLRAGAIPIILSDTLKLPFSDMMEKCVLRVPEENVFSIPDILNGISVEDEKTLRRNGMQLFDQICGENGDNMWVPLLKEFVNVFTD